MPGPPPPPPERKPQLVLAVGLDGVLDDSLAPVLGRSEFEVRRVVDLPQASKLVGRVRFDAILIARAEDEDELHDLLVAVRDPGSPSVRASVALFLPPAEMPLARAYQSAGADQVVPATLGKSDQQSIVLRLLRAKMRVEARVLARLAVRLERGVTQRLCQTRDLSRNGMFVLTGERFPLGAPVQFQLELGSGLSVRGSGVIVRCVIETPNHAEGVGVEFHDFQGDGRGRLDAFLDALRD